MKIKRNKNKKRRGTWTKTFSQTIKANKKKVTNAIPRKNKKIKAKQREKENNKKRKVKERKFMNQSGNLPP